MIEVKPVVSKKEWKAFYNLPHSIYKDDPNWVAQLRPMVEEALDNKKNPFYKHAIREPFLAYRNGVVVGRIVGVVDQNHNEHQKETTAFFGFYEAIDDQEVANALLETVKTWALSKGMNKIRGPASPSTNHECALLIDGFDQPPVVMMTYNPKYYATQFENWGLAKAKDFFTWAGHPYSTIEPRLLKHIERIKKRKKITIRPIDYGTFKEDLEILHDIYNDAWKHNWGFVPMNKEEFFFAAKNFKMFADRHLIMLIFVDGEPAGFTGCLPDLNQGLKKLKNGKLFPFGFLKLIWDIKGPGRKKTITRIRIITLGMKKKFNFLGLGPIIYQEIMKVCKDREYPDAEAGWVLEDNHQMNDALKQISFKKNKTYRIYDRSLTQ